ncbi:methylaspartate mutase [Streptomyces sp. ISL-11]|uniref:methylaspartate mutase n=1 Tax=Streptomyces sp. ISL-11 TaxID=2819174 RepID=UPI001BEAD707|nr:methylaspartate mutase [Streptomyces sp. ISL-11]MBT2383210.1 methylaspartate mutase [Streptomyces sp. ISL-11]
MSVDFGAFVRARAGEGHLVVQPRMGFSDPRRMRDGLAATRAARATTVGTITLDAHTRVGHLAAVESALRDGIDLNGYPVVSHDADTTRWVLAGIRDAGFPVQVRHGSATPADIFRALNRLWLDASEGGPVSYCLPYGRTPLRDSVRNWEESCELFLGLREHGAEPHLETFGGCMLGQLCPPSQLVAISVLEALFFVRHGLRSVSVSYAQQTHAGQDREAVAALRRLCAELLPTDNWHVVVYAYMGLYPQTSHGALRLLGEAAELAVATGSERLIVKTEAESRRIPTVAENVRALEHASSTARAARPRAAEGADSQTYQEAAALVHAVLGLHADVGQALLLAFRAGYLDIPYCLHPDNRGETRSYIDDSGRLRWDRIGRLPIGGLVARDRPRRVTSAGLLDDLSYVRRRFDEAPLGQGVPARALSPAPGASAYRGPVP